MRTRAEIAEAFAPKSALKDVRCLFFVGIGGAGMSGLVGLAVKQGFRVSGSDSSPSPATESLGVAVRIGHSEDLPEDVEALVLSDAVDLDSSPEVRSARARGLPLFRRSQLLGWLLRNHRVAAVTGTHGKTTTTGLLGSALVEAGLDPLVVVGATVPEFGGPVRAGDGVWAVVEACEAYDGMHDLDPSLIVLTNLELDHADFHGDFSQLVSSMVRFADRLPPDGILVYPAADAGASTVAAASKARSKPYRMDASLNPRLPGEHNRMNASAALAAFVEISVEASREAAIRGIESFGGAERRLQVLKDGEVTVVDDYAHHPTEILSSIEGLRLAYPGRRLVVVFQPHLYSRTHELMDAFAEALSSADFVVLTDIYPARETPIPGTSSAVIADRVGVPTRYVPSRHQLAVRVREWLTPGDVVVGMGAGTIGEFGPALIEELRDRPLQVRNRPLRIAVLYAGDSSEREVSILSGHEIQAALLRLGHDSTLVDMTEMLLARRTVAPFGGPERPDLAFLALHGTHAEDGAVQGMLELLGIPYTGSGIQASALAMDKAMTKRILKAEGILVPKGTIVKSLDDVIELCLPLVVKPNAEGSTVGVSFVREPQDLCSSLVKAFRYGASVIVEELIEGVEVSVPVLDGRALLPVEIAPAGGFYDFASKYTPGATDEIIPARLSESLLAKCQSIATRAHEVLGCAGATRTDMIVRGEDVYALELNTLPGMTPTSLLPNSARAAGIEFDELCQRLVDDALRRNGVPA